MLVCSPLETFSEHTDITSLWKWGCVWYCGLFFKSFFSVWFLCAFIYIRKQSKKRRKNCAELFVLILQWLSIEHIT